MSFKLLKKIIKHKFITLIILVLIAGGIYLYHQNAGEEKTNLQYVVSSVTKGFLTVSVSGSGQASASNQIDVKPKVSGDLVYVGAENGQEVKAGELLAQIDSSSAQKAVRDAETALETAELELEELLQPVDDYALMQAENSLIQAKDSLTKLKFTQESNYQNALNTIKKAEDNLEKSYEDTFNAIANAFLDLPTIITGLRDILYGEEIADNENSLAQTWNKAALVNSVDAGDSTSRNGLEKFIDRAETNYTTAKEKYDDNFQNYKDASRYSKKEIIENLLDETIEAVKAMSEATKGETNMLDYWVDYRSQKNLRIYSTVTSYQSSLSSYTSKVNSHLSNLLSNQRTIEDYKETKIDAERDMEEMEQNNPMDLAASERTVEEKEEALVKLKEDPDELEVRAKKITIQQKQDILSDARQALADHFIKTPFDGVIAGVNVKKGESISSSTAIATLITKQKIAEITLNEIDIAKVEVGQSAIITFDALDNLVIKGIVSEIDAIGTTSSGVVTYNVRISFDSQDEKIKPGMSLSVEIITVEKDDVLLVSNSAIKQLRNESYVQIVELNDDKIGNRNITLDAASISDLHNQSVQIGISNDTMTEITDGLNEGDRVVIQTINSGSNSSSSQTQSSSSSSVFPGMTPSGGEMREVRQFTH